MRTIKVEHIREPLCRVMANLNHLRVAAAQKRTKPREVVAPHWDYKNLYWVCPLCGMVYFDWEQTLRCIKRCEKEGA